jgi:hypothetical protein
VEARNAARLDALDQCPLRLGEAPAMQQFQRVAFARLAADQLSEKQ